MCHVHMVTSLSDFIFASPKILLPRMIFLNPIDSKYKLKDFKEDICLDKL